MPNRRKKKKQIRIKFMINGTEEIKELIATFKP